MSGAAPLSSFDCIVIGGGHAGVEAAHAAARMGARTALLTIRRQAIARMSCNPAIGGLAKGQIVREIDALGGLMALAIDATGIQFRLLNRSKGPAVRSGRAQADKHQYEVFVRNTLEATDNLTVIEATVDEVLTQDGAVRGVRCVDGSTYSAPTVVVAAGTFLRGLMHIGTEQSPGGRLAEPSAEALSDSLRRAGLQLGRLKTGTPPRLDAATVDYDKLEVQPGDDKPMPFSFLTAAIDRPQIPCWITWTNPAIHELIRSSLDRAPLYSGQITSTGPRYCPSVETKILRFADKDRHQVFLEPEDACRTTIYCNGISTSLPRDIQERIVALLPGAERARIVHYGYAIEYDYAPPTQIAGSLEVRGISGLFLAGQINGTSGYEEAAGQGLIAGINAVRKLQGRDPLVLGRDQAYIGVMIDDLRTRGIDEPYRMFTSRAEHRLALRSDNADRRLTQIGRSVGLVDDHRWAVYQQKLRAIEELRDYLACTRIQGRSLCDLLRRPGADIGVLLAEHAPALVGRYADDVLEAVAVDVRYEGYLTKQQRLQESMAGLDARRIPSWVDYAAVAHLRAEAREKLGAFRPETLGQAARISGITPADITVLQIHLHKSQKGSGTFSAEPAGRSGRVNSAENVPDPSN